MTTTLYLVRHAEAASSGTDPALSARGLDQARRLAARLRELPIDAILSSPKVRAMQTARVVAAACSAPLAMDPLLDDRTPVPSAGRRSDYPENLQAWLDRVPDDERDVDGRQLSAAAARFLVADDRHRHLVLVTHLFVVGWFVRVANEAPISAWTTVTVGNTGLTTIRCDAGQPAEVLGVDDRLHLVASGGDA